MPRSSAAEKVVTLAACSQWMPTGFLKRGSSWKRDDDHVAGFQHLGGGLGEA